MMAVQSKPLPTYLIAFTVGDVDVVEWEDLKVNDVRSTPIPLRGIATKGKGEKLTYALENTYDILYSLEEYFGIPYPYEKLDIVAVPDFAFGAMENAGLIIYREQLLLFDDTMSLNQDMRYKNVHGHELAHQWFGNLVTPEWWDDIWLNEAFATWIAHVTNDNIYPEQKFRQTLQGRALGAMRTDELTSSRQIRQPILSNHDIDSAFDGITYSKGGGVLSMLETYLGRETFRQGIQNYMKKYAWGNATATNFIEAVAEKADGKSVDTIRNAFNSFLEQPGIPYLNTKTNCNNNEIKQQCELLTKAEETITLDTKTCPSFIMPNAAGSGYYRFAQTGDDWKNLFTEKDQLTAEELMSANDSFIASINAGQLSFTDLVNTAPQIIDSSSARVATAPLRLLRFAYDRVAKDEKQKASLQELASTLYSDKLSGLGLETKKDDDVDTIQLRNSLIGYMSKYAQDQEVRTYLIEMAKAYTGYESNNVLNPKKADSNTISHALTVASEDIGVDFSRHLMKLFETETDGTIRGRLLSGISSTKDAKLTKELRSWILSEKIRDNEIYTIMVPQLRDPDLNPDMWQWIKENFDGIKSRVSSFSQGRLPFLGGYACSDEAYADTKAFFTPIVDNISGGPRTLAQSLEGVKLCSDAVKHHAPNINEYLAR